MFELEINGVMYTFKLGMRFLRDINKTVTKPLDGMPGQAQNVGLKFAIGSLIDGDLEQLVEILFLANAGCSPRITKAALDAYIEDEVQNIDQLFEDVLGFFKSANCTKKETMSILKAVEEAQK